MRRAGGRAGRFIALAGIGVIGGLGSVAPASAEPTPVCSVEAELPITTSPLVDPGRVLGHRCIVRPVAVETETVPTTTPTTAPTTTPAPVPVAVAQASAPAPAPAPVAPGPAPEPVTPVPAAPAPEVAIPADTAAPSAPAPTRDVPAAREAVLGATRSFTLLFVLAALVTVFLAATGRLERRDPKLAAAPLDENHLEFP
ncbi:MAG: hypothetical protein ACT4PI_01950 [Actinomycetota bacterium]